MKNYLTLFLVVFALHSAAFAGDNAAPAGVSDQSSDLTLREIQAKLGQMRSLSSDIQAFLKQETDRLAQSKKDKEKAGKNDKSADEAARSVDGIKKIIAQVCDEYHECEKQMSALSKQMEQVARARDEEMEQSARAQSKLESARQERLASEADMKKEEEKLQAAKKDLANLNLKLSDMTKQVDEAKDKNKTLQDAVSALERERAQRIEAIGVVKKEIVKARDEHRECEKRMSALSKQMEQAAHAQAELESARQDRLASEADMKKERENLQAAKKNLADLKQKISDMTRQMDDAKEQKQTLQDTAAALERERAQRTEAITRAEKSVEVFEKVEQERLRLATQLAELEKVISPKQQDIAERERLAAEIENEKKYMLETQEKIRNDEAALAKSEKSVGDLKKQLEERRKAAAAAARPEEMKALKSDLERAKERRAEADSRLKEIEARRRQAADSVASLTNQLAEMTGSDAEMRKSAGLLEQAKAELENEKKGLAEVEEKIVRAEKTTRDADLDAADLKRLLAERKKAAIAADKTDEMNRLKADLADIRKDRADEEERMKQANAMLQEAEKSRSAMKDMIAEVAIRQEHNKATMKVIADMTAELEAEKAARAQFVASLDNKGAALKAIEDENAKLKNSFRDVSRELEKTGEVTNRLNEIRLQLAEQHKLRTSIEEKVRDAGQNQDVLEKDLEQLRKAIANANEQIKRNDDALKMAEMVDGDLREEKSNNRKAEALIKDRQQAISRMAAEKDDLEKKLKDAEIKLAEQLKQNKALEDMRRQLTEEKKARIVAEKKSSELAKAEQEYRDKLKELNEKMRETTKRSQNVSRGVDSYDTDASYLVASKDDLKSAPAGQPADAVQDSVRDPLAEEQKLLKAARSGGSRSRSGDAGEASLEKSRPERLGRSLEEAEAHYAMGVQKWDEQDVEGAMEEFKKTVQLNPDAAGAYYNLALGSLKLNNNNDACDYAYKSGITHIKTGNLPQAARMAALIGKINPQSPLVDKLRRQIGLATPAQ